MIYNECPNHDVINWLIIGMIFAFIMLIIIWLLMRKIVINYEDLIVQNEVLQRDLELNTILKHEHIQKMLCPHDLITFNNEHVYTVDKCSKCNKQCKRECWTQYYIDKVNKGGN